MSNTTRTNAALKAWDTRRSMERAKKLSDRANKAWATRRLNAGGKTRQKTKA